MVDETLYAKDLIDVLKKKHKAGTYKEMVLDWFSLLDLFF